MFTENLDGSLSFNKSSSAGVGWEALRKSSPGDIWLFGHTHTWDGADLRKFLAPVPAARVAYVTMFREPSDWLRSVYNHFNDKEKKIPFTKWLLNDGKRPKSLSAGLDNLDGEYLRMLPEALSRPFRYGVRAFRFGGPNGTPLSDPPAETTRALALKMFAEAIDYEAVECHLRGNILTLISEYHDLSMGLLGFALTGDVGGIMPDKEMGGESRAGHLHPSRTPPYFMGNQTAGEMMRDISRFAPVISPFEAVYGIAVKVFKGQVQEAKQAGARF